MGQNQSQQKSNADLYDQYIKQQQQLIYQQQQQINSLYRYNMNMTENAQTSANSQTSADSQTPANIIFEQQQIKQQKLLEEKEKQLRNIQSNQSNQPKLLSGRLDPYKVLNIGHTFDEKMLKKAYLRAAVKAHPDRGGSEDQFQIVSIAYALLQKKLKTEKVDLNHHELKKKAENDISLQNSQQMKNINMQNDFDINVFNKIYEENKIKDVFDDGYDDWMNNSQAKKPKKMFQSGFNKDMFNSEFDKYKRENHNSSAVVEYQEPEVRMSLSNQDSLMLLGRDKVTDFSGETNSMNFTDYKKAYTDGSTLIDINSVSIDGRSNSMNSIKKERSRISYQMSDGDIQRQRILEVKRENDEKQRLQRLQMTDKQNGEVYEKIHGLLLR